MVRARQSVRALEDDPPHPINRYGRSKLASEALVRERCQVPWTILRPCAVYGPRDRGFLPLFRLARRGLTFLATPPATSFTLLFIDDLVKAILLAATRRSRRAARLSSSGIPSRSGSRR